MEMSEPKTCIICTEQLKDDEAIINCTTCPNGFHAECFKQTNSMKCPICRCIILLPGTEKSLLSNITKEAKELNLIPIDIKRIKQKLEPLKFITARHRELLDIAKLNGFNNKKLLRIHYIKCGEQVLYEVIQSNNPIIKDRDAYETAVVQSAIERSSRFIIEPVPFPITSGEMKTIILNICRENILTDKLPVDLFELIRGKVIDDIWKEDYFKPILKILLIDSLQEERPLRVPFRTNPCPCSNKGCLGWLYASGRCNTCSHRYCPNCCSPDHTEPLVKQQDSLATTLYILLIYMADHRCSFESARVHCDAEEKRTEFLCPKPDESDDDLLIELIDHRREIADVVGVDEDSEEVDNAIQYIIDEFDKKYYDLKQRMLNVIRNKVERTALFNSLRVEWSCHQSKRTPCFLCRKYTNPVQYVVDAKEILHRVPKYGEKQATVYYCPGCHRAYIAHCHETGSFYSVYQVDPRFEDIKDFVLTDDVFNYKASLIRELLTYNGVNERVIRLLELGINDPHLQADVLIEKYFNQKTFKEFMKCDFERAFIKHLLPFVLVQLNKYKIHSVLLGKDDVASLSSIFDVLKLFGIVI